MSESSSVLATQKRSENLISSQEQQPLKKRKLIQNQVSSGSESTLIDQVKPVSSSSSIQYSPEYLKHEIKRLQIYKASLKKQLDRVSNQVRDAHNQNQDLVNWVCNFENSFYEAGKCSKDFSLGTNSHNFVKSIENEVMQRFFQLPESTRFKCGLNSKSEIPDYLADFLIRTADDYATGKRVSEVNSLL